MLFKLKNTLTLWPTSDATDSIYSLRFTGRILYWSQIDNVIQYHQILLST